MKTSVFKLELTSEQQEAADQWIFENLQKGERFAAIGQIHPDEGIAKFGFYGETEFECVQKVMDQIKRR